MKKLISLCTVFCALILASCGNSNETKSTEEADKNKSNEQGGATLDLRIKCSDIEAIEGLTDNFSGTLKKCKDGYVVSTSEYEKGIISGCSRTYHENGQLASEAYFKRETATNEIGEEFAFSEPSYDSISRRWYSSGSIKVIEKRGSFQKFYYENGQIKMEETKHPSGMIKSTSCFDEKGNEIDCSSINVDDLF